jgi:hypothetical protein
MPYQDHTVYVEDADGNEIELVATIEWWPAQNGGLTDPSWEAGWEVSEVNQNGAMFLVSKDQHDSIVIQVESQLEQSK